MTYRELETIINKMSPDECNCDVTILDHQEEVFGTIGICRAIDVGMDEVLDDDHPVIVLNGVFNERELKDLEERILCG